MKEELQILAEEERDKKEEELIGKKPKYHLENQAAYKNRFMGKSGYHFSIYYCLFFSSLCTPSQIC